MSDRRTALHFSNRLRQLFRGAINALTLDWRTSKTYCFAGLLLLITTLVVIVYYVNNPQPFVGPDSFEYIANAQRIATHWQFVDPHRLPGFPLLIVLVFALAGQGNIMAISIANGVLFTVATLEIYVIALLLFQRRWLAFLLGLLVGTNVVLLSFVKPIGSEALALWLVVTLALVATVFVRTLRIRYLWMVMACTLALILTRLEWTYLPVPLFAYLVLVAARRGSTLRHLLLHALASVVLVYAVLAGYIFINATQYHFVGISDIQNINVFGKVIQYNMQNEAPAQYTAIAQTTNIFRSHGGINPYDLLDQHPELKNNHFALVGAYSQSVIEHHPVEFLARSVPVMFSSLDYFYYESEVDPHSFFARPLFGMNFVFHVLYKLNLGFPLIAAAWIFLLCWRRTARLFLVQAMGVLLLVVLYGIVITTLGGYSSYIRFHTPFYPLMIIILWGGVLAGLLMVVRQESRDITPAVSSATSQLSGALETERDNFIRISVVVPVYNEEETVAQVLVTLSRVPLDLEVVVVDDASTDHTWEILQELQHYEPFASYRYIRHESNRGKGAGLRTGFGQVSGDLVTVQDADAEYDPHDLPALVHKWEEGRRAGLEKVVVYGYRDLSSQKFTTRWGNRFLTSITNILFGSRIHDMETCYKVIPGELARVLPLEGRRFEIEPEITSYILQAGYAILEVPISYVPRREKKLSPWKDGWPALAMLFRRRFSRPFQLPDSVQESVAEPPISQVRR